MPYPKDEKALARWSAQISKEYAKDPAGWNKYDAQFMSTVSTYNEFLKATPGFSRLPWMMVKAVSWVESGSGNPNWEGNLMQIGVATDPGLDDLLTSANGKLICPPQFRPFLNRAVAQTVPQQNIRAAVGYMLLRFARFGYVDPSAEPVSPFPPSKVTPPRHAVPKPKVLGITGWRAITLPLIAQRYNGGGDGNYQAKLEYAYRLIQTGVPEVTQ